MRHPVRALVVVVLAVLYAAAVVWSLSGLPGLAGPSVAGTLLCWAVFCVAPWSVLPVGIIGGSIVAGLIGDDVRTLVVTHSLPLLAGLLALVTRRVLLGPDRPTIGLRQGLGMALLLAATATAATYGLAAGNIRVNVLVATYQIAIIPVYFFLAVFTLNSPRRLRNGAVLYVGVIALLTAIEFDAPGRHGGLLSMLAVPPLVILAGRAHGWRRAGLALLAAGLAADVVLASFRSVWIAGAVAMAVLVLRGRQVVGRGLLALTGTAVLLVTLVSLDAGVRVRSGVITDSLDRSAGYRGPESAIGLDVFVSRPLFGAGLGQTTPHVYVPGFTVTNVGPIYHAFYVSILANVGLLGLCAVLWPIVRTVWTGVSERDSLALSFAALTCGFLIAAVVAAPSDGHWELGLLPALTLLTAARGPATPRPAPPPPLPVPARIPPDLVAPRAGLPLSPVPAVRRSALSVGVRS